MRRGVVGQQRCREGRVRRRDGVAVGRDAQRVVAVGQRSRERSLQMQVANDVAFATSSQVLKPAQAGALTTPPPESCRAASSAGIASRALWSAVSLAESAAFVAYKVSSVASALAPWSAEMLASRLASCAATKASVARPSTAFAILLSTSSGVSSPSIRGEQGPCRLADTNLRVLASWPFEPLSPNPSLTP